METVDGNNAIVMTLLSNVPHSYKITSSEDAKMPTNLFIEPAKPCDSGESRSLRYEFIPFLHHILLIPAEPTIILDTSSEDL